MRDDEKDWLNRSVGMDGATNGDVVVGLLRNIDASLRMLVKRGNSSDRFAVASAIDKLSGMREHPRNEPF